MRSKLNLEDDSDEKSLFIHSIYFLLSRGGAVPKVDFPTALYEFLLKNNFLTSNDLVKSEDQSGSRGNEVVVLQRIRNLVSHGTIFTRNYISENEGNYALKREFVSNFGIKPDSLLKASLNKSSLPRKIVKIGRKPQILVGPPGTGKTLLANSIIKDHKYFRVQFHPSYTYEFFVQGERLITLKNERYTQIVDGPLMVLYRKSTNTPFITKALVRHKSDKITVSFPTGIIEKYSIHDTSRLLVVMRAVGRRV